MYGKGRDLTERKYYHFKLSCNPDDNPTPEQSHALAEKLAQELFADYEVTLIDVAETPIGRPQKNSENSIQARKRDIR